MPYKRMIVAILLALTLALFACAEPAAENAPAAEPAGEGAVCEDVDESEDGTIVGFGDFTTKDVDGNDVDQTIFAKAKLTVFNVWGTFCGPCIAELQDFAELQAQYAEKGVQFVGLVGDVNAAEDGLTEEQRAEVQDIIEKTGADYLHLLPSADLNRLVLQYIQAYPTTTLIDADGNFVGEAYVGTQPVSTWTKLFDDYLASLA